MSKRNKTKSASTNIVTPGTIHSIPLIEIPLDEFRASKYRIKVRSEKELGRLAREFRTTNTGLYKYVPYTASTPRELAYENSFICAWARRVCAIVKTHYGIVPILDEAEIRQSEDLAKKMLADAVTLKHIKKMGVIRMAEIAMVEGVDIDGSPIIPDAKRVLLKVLTLVIAFSVAVWKHEQTTTRPASP
jgi:hypothetical protein